MRLQSEQFAEIVADNGGGPFEWSTDAAARAALWKARHNAYWAAKALIPDMAALSTDVCVPISRFADCEAETEADIVENGFTAPIVDHAATAISMSLCCSMRRTRRKLPVSRNSSCG